MIPLILSAASLCLCVIGFLFFRSYIDRKTAARELLADYRAEIYRLIAEIDAAADRDSLLVEERIKTLKKLLDDTDRRISVYMRELQRSRAGEAMYASLGRGIRAALDSAPLKASPSEAASLEATVPPTPQSLLSTEPPAPPSPESIASDTRPSAVKRKPKKGKIKTQIAEMSAKGCAPAEIASKLGVSLAEVDLALNLIQH